MSERWLRCEVRKGMFTDEKVVVIKTKTGDIESFFVPAERVNGNVNHEGRVKVRFVQQDSRAWAVVPNENQTFVAVDESQFVAA